MKKRKGTRFLSILLALCVIATTGVISPLHTGAESVDSAPVTEEASQEQTAEASVSPAAEVSSAGTQEAASETEETAAVTEETAAPQDGQQSVSPAAAEETQQQAAAAGSSTDAAAASGADTSSAADGTEAATAEEPAANTAEETPVEEGQEEAVSYPEQSFTGTANNVTVNVYAPEGVFPEGTTMSVTGVSSETAMSIAGEAADSGTEVVDAIGVDITFRDASGQEIEPKDGQSVQVSMSVEAGSALSGDSFSVVHQEDTGAVETVTQEASADGAVFTADAFSIYVITGAGTAQQTPAVETWNFYGADNTTLLSTQSVKQGDTIVSPETPEKDGYLFQGWAYSVANADAGTVDVTAFTTRTADVSITQTIDLYPVFSQKLYVFFMDTDTYGRVWQTKEGTTGTVISTSDVTLPLGSEQSVTGWYTDKDMTGEAVAEVTLNDSDVTLYPKVESGHYLFFSSGDGASYVAPQFVSANAVTVKPADPTRSGYTFVGWSASQNPATADYTFGGKLTENTTVYAVWKANRNTKYTVIYWNQSVNDDKNADDSEKTYDYAGSDTRTGTSGQTVSPSYADRNKGYTGFQYNSSKSVSVTINGDGTTILNVYYDRNTLTINFYIPLGWNWSLYKTLTGLYGQTLAQNGDTWPSEYRWSDDYSVVWTFLDSFIFDGNDTTLKLYGDNPTGRFSINHYKQNLDGDYGDPANTTKSAGGTFYFSNKYNGFTVSSYKRGNGNWITTSETGSVNYNSNLYIRYTRNDYKLSFYNYNGVSREEQVLYEASLKSYESYVPERPSDLSDEFNFEGWYKDPELTQKFDFNQNMPAGGITLYAKWAEPTYNGTVHLTIDGTGATTGLTIGYGAPISEADMPTVVDADGNPVFQGNDKNTVTLPKDVDWIGWATKDGTQYTAFHFATKIYSDITLYPYYVSKTKYTVTYDVNGGSGAVTDSKEYASGAYADIQSGKGVTAPEGKAFLYWNTNKDGQGISYYPGDKLLVTNNITLYAVYGDPAETTSLTYKTNYPEGSSLEDADKMQSVNDSKTLQNNASFQALTLTDAGFAVPDGYYFKGWNTAADGSGTSVAAGTDILVDADGTNILYAQWEKKQAVVLTVTGKTESVPYDGKEHLVKGYTTAITVNGAAATALPENLKLDEEKAKAKAATGTDAGTYSTGLVEGDFSITGSDLERYSVTVQVTDGRLTIQPRTVTLTSADATMAYDGTALTAPEVTIGSLGFVDGEVTSVTAKGTQTAVGTSDNKPIEIVKGTNYKDSNYEITEEYGTLTVTASTALFTIEAKDAEKTYDGTALTESGYTVTKPQGFENFKVTAVVSGTITDAGTEENTVDSYTIKDPSGTVVTGNFTNVTTANGTLKVNPRKVTLHSQSQSKEYDGTALTAPAVTTSDPAFVDGEVTDIKATGTITDVGSVKNTIAYTGTDKFKKTNYDIELDEGTLTVSKSLKKITITAESDSKTYDGTALTNSNYKVEGLPDGFTVSDVTVTGSATNVTDTKSGNNVVTGGKILNAEGKDVTEYFADITRIDGTLEILPRQVKLTSATDAKPYDGTPLTNSKVDITGDGFVDGEVSDVRATGSITDVGTVDNPISYTTNDAFQADNYQIKEVMGKLTVAAANVDLVITASSETFKYDGTAHSTGNTGVTVSWSPEGSGSNYTVEAVVEGSVTNVSQGEVENKITSYKILNANGDDITKNFDSSRIKTVSGTIRVTPRPVTLTSQSATREYNGTALTAPDVTVGGDGFVDGEVSDIKAIGTIIKAGFVTNEIVYTTGTNFAALNYEIEMKEGTLTVTQNQSEITITAGSSSKKYDGTALANGSYTVEGLPEGFTVSGVTVSGSATNVSDTNAGNNKVTGGKILYNKEDVTGQFTNIKRIDGTLEILPRQVKLTSATDSKKYDGKPLTNSTVTEGGDKFVQGEVTDLKATGSQTEKGTSNNPISYKTVTGKFRTENYKIEEVIGTLTVYAADTELVLTAPSGTWKYDGTAHSTGNNVTVTWPSADDAAKYTVTATVSGSVKDVEDGTVDNVIDKNSIKITDSTGRDVTGNFVTSNIKTVNGTLSVYARQVTLTSKSAEKAYDGTALTAPEVTVSGSGFVDGEVDADSIKATGSITKVGDAANPITYTTTGAFKESNYNITKEEGTLTIRQNTTLITVKSADDSKTYDGKPLTNDTITTTGLPEGFTLTAEVTGSITDVDPKSPSGNNTVANAVIKDKDGNVVTNQFSNITYQAGTLSVLPRKVTLESKSDSKPYDGTALTAPDVTVGGDGFVDGEVTDIKATGTITEKGSVKNTITYTKQAAYKDSNYIVTETTGTLTIFPANVELVITAPSQTWEYDGTAHSTAHSTGNSGVTVSWAPEGSGSNYKVEAVVEGSVMNVSQGKVDNKIVSYTIRNADGKDVTDQFDSKLIQTVNGTLQVTPRYVELTSASAEKPYDGTALTASEVTVGDKNFVDGEVSNLKATGSALTTDDGEVTNTIEWTAGKNFDSKNYTIVKHEGILKITQNQTDITVTAGSATKVYDGKVLTNSAATVTGLPTEFTATVTVEGSAKNVADTKTGNNQVKAVKITKDEKDVTGQFANITKKDGTLTITKRPVTLTSESGSKPYDGTALKLPKVTVTGDGFVDGEVTDIKATGSITKVGSAANTITYTTTGAFKESNYNITKEVGTLSISKAEIAFRVTANSHTWPYNGEAHTDNGYTVTIPDNYKETYGKFTVEAVVEGSVTNVTEKQVANKITKVTVKKQNGLLWDDVTDQFDTSDMILEDGVLEIRPAELTLTSKSGSKEYDGTPLELPKVKVEGSIITTNGKAQISNIRATGSVTGVTTDPIPNTISYDTSEDFIPDNYVIIMKEGTLTVTKNTKTKIVFTADSAEKTYDGTPLTASNVTVEGLEKLPKGFTAQAEAGGSITNVTQTAEGNNPVVKAIILDKDGKNVTDWFKNVTKTAGTLTITPREITLTSADDEKPYDGTALTAPTVTATGTHGLADTHTIEYTFTGSQTYVGSSLNTFTYLIKDKEGNEIPVSPVSKVTPAPKKSFRAASQDSVQKGNYNITVVYGTLTVTDDVKPEKVVSKTHDGKAYQLGEQIVFEIKVTNIYDTAQTITLTEQDDVVFTGPDIFTDVQPGETVTTSAYHVVNEEDLAKGSYTNTVKAAFKEVGKTWEGTDEEDQFAHLTLAKEVTNAPANGTAYVNGETVNYRITVTNDGTAKLYSLNIADVMTGDEWNNIQSLAPGEKLTFETSWKVTDKDVENGYVRNQAVGNAKDAKDNYVRPQPASVQVPVQKAKPSLYVEKTSDKDKAVELGETIHYTICVVNNGNTPVSDIVVTDEMTGDSWDAGTLKPGEDKTFRTEYVVTEKDILAGSVKNVALADGKDPNGDKPDVTPGEKEDKTVPENSHLTLTKTTTSSPKNRSGYAAGETIRYRIEAVNDGNLTLTDVEVKDPLTGETWKVEKLAPGEKQTFETKYTVTEKDQNAGKVVNEATAKGKTPGSSELIVVPGKTSDPVLPKAAASVTVSNTVQTGDPTQTGAYLAMLFVAAGGILVLARKKKKERRK